MKNSKTETSPAKMFERGWESFGEPKTKSFYETSTKDNPDEEMPEYKIVKTTTSTTTTPEPITHVDDGWLKSR